MKENEICIGDDEDENEDIIEAHVDGLFILMQLNYMDRGHSIYMGKAQAIKLRNWLNTSIQTIIDNEIAEAEQSQEKG